jgi:hypothetical protein
VGHLFLVPRQQVKIWCQSKKKKKKTFNTYFPLSHIRIDILETVEHDKDEETCGFSRGDVSR